MNISPVNATKGPQKGKKIGTAIGLGAGSFYTIRHAKDSFTNAAKLASGKVGGKAAGYAIVGGTYALLIGATTLAGRAIGGLVDKMTQKASEKKVKAALAETLSKQIDKAPTMKLSEFEALVHKEQNK